MRIADVLNRRNTPAAPAARVVRNRWSDLESAPPDGWSPELSATPIRVALSSLDDARAAAAGSRDDVVVFADAEHPADDLAIARLIWWQHVCAYAVSVAPGIDGSAEDSLSLFQRQSDQLNRAGYEAFRGAAAGVIAVPRTLYDAAGGLDTGSGSGWQLELAYRLAQRGAVFVVAPDVQARRGASIDDTSALADAIPLLPERRPDWRRTHPVPAVHVVVDCATAPDAATATLTGVLDGEFRDVTVSVIGWAGRTPPSDPRVHVAAEPPQSFPSPFRLELPAGCLLHPYSVRRMLNRMRESQLGLYQAIVEPDTEGSQRSFAVRLMRGAAIERARLLSGPDDLDDTIDELFGSTWVDGRRFGLRHYADAADAISRDIDEDSDGPEDEVDEDDD